MAFSPTFHLLKKFTAGLLEHSPEAESASDGDVDAAAAYLGIDLSLMDHRAPIEAIRAELHKQNQYLTAHLDDKEIEGSDLYGHCVFAFPAVPEGTHVPFIFPKCNGIPSVTVIAIMHYPLVI